MVNLSVCMIAWNEGALLNEALSSVSPIADEFIIGIDSRTTDNTQEIAQMYQATIIPFDWHDDFSKARNVVLDRAAGNWVFSLDCDERVNDLGLTFIPKLLLQDKRPYSFNCRNLKLDGTEIVQGVVSCATRLFPNSSEYRWVGNVHEAVYGPKQAEFIPVTMIEHFGYDPVLYEQRNKDKRNTDLLTERIAVNPNDIEAWYYLILQHLSFGRTDKALTAARHTLSLDNQLTPELITQLNTIISAITNSNKSWEPLSNCLMHAV